MNIGTAINVTAIKQTEKFIDPVASYSNALVASVDDMLVEYAGDTLRLSRDGGLTFTESLDIPNLDIIKYIHLYADGKLLVANQTNCYYTHDWQTYGVSQTLNVDGTPFTPPFGTFNCYKNSVSKKIVDGVEIAIWGGYSPDARTWYSPDYGQTVRVCYQFNQPDTLTAAHVHAVDFNPADQSFWLQSGDYDYESHWVKGIYDVAADSWDWQPFASGLNFKTTNMIFHTDGYVYWSWDMHPGGAVRAPIATMGDIATHEVLVRTNKDCHFLIIGERGDIVVFQTTYNGTDMPRIMYYAPDGKNFKKITGKMPVEFDSSFNAQYQTYWGINNKGKILAGVQDLTVQNIADWDRKPSVFIDDFIRAAGYPNAFR